MKLFYLFAVLLFVTACTPLSKPFSSLYYLGSRYAATDSVAVFVDASAIDRPYTIIGKGFVKWGYAGWQPLPKIQADAVAKAKENGADAVLIQDYIVPTVGYSTEVRTDSLGGVLRSVGSTTATHTDTRNFTFLFLKYK